MRVIAGVWRGRAISAPKGASTRPTSDRTREGIFSSIYTLLGPLDGRRVADLYAGSGALGFEALSRGAAHCLFVESARAPIESIRANAARLGVSEAAFTLLGRRVEEAVRHVTGTNAVSLLLADPPYRIDAAAFSQVLEGLAARGFLEVGALVAYEHASVCEPVWPPGFTELKTRQYGDSAVSFATYDG